MRKFIAVVIALSFFIWILPLGFFIKPSKEKLACNGQRAICMCSHLMAKQAAKNAGKMFLKGGGGAQTEKIKSSASGTHFLFVKIVYQVNDMFLSYRSQPMMQHSFLFVRDIEHVPKDKYFSRYPNKEFINRWPLPAQVCFVNSRETCGRAIFYFVEKSQFKVELSSSFFSSFI